MTAPGASTALIAGRVILVAVRIVAVERGQQFGRRFLARRGVALDQVVGRRGALGGREVTAPGSN